MVEETIARMKQMEKNQQELQGILARDFRVASGTDGPNDASNHKVVPGEGSGR